ncbi:MAG: heavy-metal-associated domain-containing protein [Bacteroidales bacterium]|nr:heavy-metal-associated domain-containing protein [Bacteroidales bacterium]
MKNLFLTALFLVMSVFLFAQEKSEIKIKTFFHCANGKALIEKELVKVDGVMNVVAELETKIVTIHYDATKQNKESLVKAIEKIGYLTEFSSKDAKINKACSHDHGEHENHKELHE